MSTSRTRKQINRKRRIEYRLHTLTVAAEVSTNPRWLGEKWGDGPSLVFSNPIPWMGALYGPPGNSRGAQHPH